MPARRINELRDRMVNRLGFERVEPHGNEVGLFARDDRADAFSKPQRARAVQRGGLQCEGRIERARIVGDALGDIVVRQDVRNDDTTL